MNGLSWICAIVAAFVVCPVGPLLQGFQSFGTSVKTSSEDAFKKISEFFTGPPKVEDPEIKMTTPQIIEHWGYPCEVHYVKTADGYILQLHRIPHGKSQTFSLFNSRGPVVFIQHGILSSSADWVINIGSQSLGFYLADSGYDVWLGNARGNFYSRNHTILDPDADEEFWDFSFQDMATLDLPAVIDYILEETGRRKLNYVGYSMGTTMAFALLSENDNYNHKINKFVALAPVANLTYGEAPLKLFSFLTVVGQDTDFVNEIRQKVGTTEMMGLNSPQKFVNNAVCSFGELICNNYIFMLLGEETHQINKTRLPVYINHAPAGTSVRNYLHYLQMYKLGKFQKYDFGPKENLKRYGKETPPEYDVSKIRTPIYIFWGQGDLIANEKNVETVVQKLRNVKSVRRIDGFTHIDFMWGAIDSKRLLHDKVFEALEDLR